MLYILSMASLGRIKAYTVNALCRVTKSITQSGASMMNQRIESTESRSSSIVIVHFFGTKITN